MTERRFGMPRSMQGNGEMRYWRAKCWMSGFQGLLPAEGGALWRVLIASCVVLAHVALIVPAALRGTRDGQYSTPPTPVTTVQLIVQSETWDRVPVPEAVLDEPKLPASTLETIQFADSLEDELAGITGPASAPRLRRFQTVDISAYARRAHVPAGHPVTVILVVNVLDDGTAGSVDVRRTSGNAQLDEAAVDYALELRWIPATRNQQPLSMRVILPVTLSTSS